LEGGDLVPNVLVVDDDHGIVNVVSALLATEDVAVRKAYSGADGLALLKQEQPDLILLDLSMPGMDGREFYHRARHQGYDGPVIVCSAYGAAQARREMGAQGAIEKPFDPDMLVELVRDNLAPAAA
jgi:CheY-like chemotaxis protein